MGQIRCPWRQVIGLNEAGSHAALTRQADKQGAAGAGGTHLFPSLPCREAVVAVNSSSSSRSPRPPGPDGVPSVGTGKL